MKQKRGERKQQSIVLGIFLVVVLVGTLFATSLVASLSSATFDERTCKRECSQDYRETRQSCNTVYRDARSECIAVKNDCRSEARADKSLCYESCSNVTDRRERAQCRRSCSQDYVTASRSCSQDYTACRNEVQDDRKTCQTLAKSAYVSCRAVCSPTHRESVFYFEELACVNAGGLYQQLCKGPYFGIICNAEPYCQCAGTNNYTCPADSFCNTEHGITVRGKGYSIPGFKTLLGEDLGDIGVCEHNPVNVSSVIVD